MSIKIAIVDDHPLLIKGLQTMLQHAANIKVTGTYHSGKELFNGLKEHQPDVLLLDIQMHDQMGDEIAPMLTRNYPDMKILVLSNMEQEYYIKTMLNNGVTGYVLKSSDESILLEAIRTVNQGIQYFDPVIRKQVAKAQQNISKSPTLTRREKEILDLIAADLSSNEIAEKLFLSKRTVDNHRLNLLLKLDVKGSASLIKKAMDLGLIK